MQKFLFWIASILCLSMVSGCGNEIKTGPAWTWDVVYVDYVATYEINGSLYDTTMKKTVEEKKESLKKETYEPMRFVVGETSTGIMSIIQEQCIGMQAGDTKTIVVDPAKGYGAQYDPNNIKKVPFIVFEKLGTSIQEGDIQKLGDQRMRVKSFTGEGKNRQVIFDANPLETYSNIIYEVFMRQVWGDSYQIPTE